MNEHKKLSEVIEECYSTAVEKGWWDEPKNDGELIALMHSELSEALEEMRNPNLKINETHYETQNDGSLKPCGVPSELADCVIRIFDYCKGRGIDIESSIYEKMKFNKNRPYKHGNKRF